MPQDIILDIMLMLKNNWNLSGDLASAASVNDSGVHFSTDLYNENITFPQVVVSPIGGETSPPLDMGSSEAIYPIRQIVGFDIWVRPMQDSNTSLGWAKNAIYAIKSETERIIRSGSTQNSAIISDDDFDPTDFDSADFTIFQQNMGITDPDVFVYLMGWKRIDNLRLRPPLFRLAGRAMAIKYIKGI